MSYAEFGRRVLEIVEEREAAQAAADEERRRKLILLGIEVSLFFMANPAAGANDAARSVVGRREDILCAVREFRALQGRFQRSRNRVEEGSS